MKSKNILALTILLSSSLSPLTVFADNNIEPAISEVPESVLSEVNRTDSEGVQEDPEKIVVNKNEVEEPENGIADLASTEQMIGNQDEGSESVDSWMPDQQLQIAVADALGIAVDELTKEKVAELGTESNNKSVQTSGVDSLEGLQYAKNGTNMVFAFRNGNISDLTPLTGLGIAQLDVENNNISDLSALKNISLNTLIIKNNNVSRLSGWGLSNSIQIINADSNHISEINSISSSTTMFLARYQTITNPPIERSEHITIPSVKHVSNYFFVENNFSISDNGVYVPLYNNYGTIEWNNLSSETDHLEYSFDRQYSSTSSEDYLKTNKVYFSGTVIQPFTGSEVSKGTVIVNYVNEDGEEIAESKILSGNIGDSYEAEQLDIPGYTFKEVRGEIQGEYTDQTQTVTFVYTKDPVVGAAVTVNYVDEDSEEIAESKILTGNIGDPYEAEELDIPGYTFKEVQGEAQGEYTDQAQTVTFVYTKDPVVGAAVTVNYVDEDGEEIAESKILTGNIGDLYEAEQLDIDGYTFKEVQGETQGEYTDQAQTVTFVYTKEAVAAAPVIVTYINDSGEEIAESKILTGNIGEAYEVEHISINGYHFKEARGNEKGIFSKESQNVIEIYEEDEKAVIPEDEVNEDTNLDNKTVGVESENTSENQNGAENAQPKYSFVSSQKGQESTTSTNKTLPETGEHKSLGGYVVGIFSLLVALVLLRFKNSSKARD